MEASSKKRNNRELGSFRDKVGQPKVDIHTLIGGEGSAPESGIVPAVLE
jgi:hypothetical protein